MSDEKQSSKIESVEDILALFNEYTADQYSSDEFLGFCSRTFERNTVAAHLFANPSNPILVPRNREVTSIFSVGALPAEKIIRGIEDHAALKRLLLSDNGNYAAPIFAVAGDEHKFRVLCEAYSARVNEFKELLAFANMLGYTPLHSVVRSRASTFHLCGVFDSQPEALVQLLTTRGRAAKSPMETAEQSPEVMVELNQLLVRGMQILSEQLKQAKEELEQQDKQPVGKPVVYIQHVPVFVPYFVRPAPVCVGFGEPRVVSRRILRLPY